MYEVNFWGFEIMILMLKQLMEISDI